jgi:hypothetical protein
LGIESPARKFGAKFATMMLLAALALSVAACGGEDASGASGERSESAASQRKVEGTTAAEKADTGAATSTEVAALARAGVGPREITSMLPADEKEPDPARPLPENPPEGIEVYPATTNKTLKEPIEYDREPPTNGNHDPLWQNCGFYERPVRDRHAVHSMDHGVVWITYRPDLPAEQIQELRSYGDERYVLISPYPDQDAPVIATSWRVQLELRGTGDPRLRQFVDQFRISEIAPLSGNRCIAGVGDPG